MAIGLPYDSLSQIAISADQYISDKTLNITFKKLVENDQALNPFSQSIPSVWECKWYNNAAAEGYSKGAAVWLNTEDIFEFIAQKHDIIYRYAKDNVYLSRAISAYDSTSKESYDLYASILSGYKGPGMLEALPPLFDLGQLSANAQVYVSIVDDNKRPPSYDILFPESQQVWKPFIKDRGYVDEAINGLKSSMFDSHVKQYHLGSLSHSIKSDLVQSWLKTDFSNIDASAKQAYRAHLNPVSTYGLDVVKYYVADRNETAIKASDGTVQKYDVPKHWFRLWSSGLLEHGGYVKADSARQLLLKVKFNWTFKRKKTTADGTAVLVELDAPAYNYPTTERSFYQGYSQIDGSTTYDSSLNFMPACRYIVDVTPMSNAPASSASKGRYEAGANGKPAIVNEVIEMKNSYMVLKLGVSSPGYYSYYVRGFKTDSYVI